MPSGKLLPKQQSICERHGVCLLSLGKRCNKGRGLSEEPRSRVDLMTFATQTRWRRFVQIASSQDKARIFVDVAQNPEFHTPPCEILPTYCRNTMIWTADVTDVDRTLRPMTPYEQLGSLGWPVLLAADDELSQRLPTPLHLILLQGEAAGVTLQALRSMAGNAMHIGQTATVIAFAYFGLQRQGMKSELE